MEIVDHKNDHVFEQAELRDETVDHRFPVEIGRWCQLLDERVRTGRGTQRVDHGEPKPLRILLAPLHGHPRDSICKPRVFEP